VVFQGWSQPPGCQFSFTCDGSLARPPMQAYWRPARAIAEQALNGYVMAEVGLATHYHTDYVSPWWKSTVVRIAQVGRHIFYRWPGAAGSPGAFTGRYAGGELALSEAVLTGKVLAPKVAPAVLLAQKVAVPDPTAPGGQTTRLHMVLGATGTAVIAPHPLSSAVRAPPTPEQVAKINELLSRKFPNEPLAALPPTQSAPKATSAVSAPSSPKPSAAQAGAEAETKPIATAPAASGAAS
jgi:hypothetical protein